MRPYTVKKMPDGTWAIQSQAPGMAEWIPVIVFETKREACETAWGMNHAQGAPGLTVVNVVNVANVRGQHHEA